jgi:hypothetical protein
MIAVIIGILMSLGIIESVDNFNQLSETEQQEIINNWVGDDSDGI